jgi:hypothetical protein
MAEGGATLLVATLLLADAATIADGKLFVLGAGWTTTGPGPLPSAVVLIADAVPPRVNKKHECEVMLVDAEGKPAVLGAARGQPDIIRFQLSVEESTQQTEPIVSSVLLHVFMIPALPLTPGNQYAWRLTVNGEERPEWTRQFSVRSESPQREDSVT